MNNISEGLVKLDMEKFQPKPAIASNWEEIEKDKEYIFSIRSNAYFSNGDRILNEDIVYSLERILALNSIEITTIDLNNRKIKISLSEKLDNFISYLGTPRFSIVKKGTYEFEGDNTFPSCFSGTFKIKYVDSKILVLEKNPYHRLFDEIELDKVTFIKITNALERLNFFQTESQNDDNQINYYFLNHGPVSMYEELKGMEELNPTPVMGTIVLTLNHENELLRNINVRKMISLAIDREELIRKTEPYLKPAYSLIPKNIIDSKAEFINDLIQIPIVSSSFDEVLEENNLNRSSLTLIVINHEHQILKARLIKQQLKQQLNLDIIVKPLDWGNYVTAIDEQNYDMLCETWNSEIGDIASYLFPLTSGNTFNTSNYNNPKFESLLMEGINTEDNMLKLQKYQNAEQILLDDMVVVPLFFETHFSFFDKKIKSIKLSKNGILEVESIHI
ncbi:ABC transporter substrate-binding protein [Lysinibacillus sp. NPDC092081]|uniref:ABC transporter substrate-binding protein n=1 Tax=Lysinibacillus sp. NPDC092081 TaxID=3364131 RepID=UPI00381CC2CB